MTPLKAPNWGSEVVSYLFAGGIMGASGLLAALADAPEGSHAALARNARYTSLALSLLCPLLLIGHLGRPERFTHMLRVLKFRSVMSLGVWGLLAFGAASAAAVTRQLTHKRAPGIARFFPRGALNAVGAILGTFITGYTGVLLSATAIPVWAGARRVIPALSVVSSLNSACALHALLLRQSQHTVRKLERLAFVCGCGELALVMQLARQSTARALFSGPLGERFERRAIVAGIVCPLLFHLSARKATPHDHSRTMSASLLTLYGAYALRQAIVEAGTASVTRLGAAA